MKVDIKKAPTQAAILIGSLIIFLIANHFLGDPSPANPYKLIPMVVGAVILIEILAFVGMEVRGGAEKHGWKHEVVDTLIALAVALALWFSATIILNTSSPISAVVSCSMKPNLERGDFIIVQGSQVAAYEIAMSETELHSLNDPAQILYENQSLFIEGSLFTYCYNYPQNELCSLFNKNPEKVVENKGVFTYRYELCSKEYRNGTVEDESCLKSVTFKGKTYLTNFSNDVIVYRPYKEDYFAKEIGGDIVHRVMFKIDVNGKNYYLTRGDNNPFLDIQAYHYGYRFSNRPVPEEHVNGKVIARIPFLGYFKLFVEGFFLEYDQCFYQRSFTTVS